MRHTIDLTVTRLRAFGENAAHVILVLRSQRRLRLVAGGGVALLVLLLGAAAYWSAGARSRAATSANPEQAWRYLLVCGNCGERTRWVEHPARTLPEKNGALKCPACGEFRAAWYRRGGQALPPGGWSVERVVEDKSALTPETQP